MSKVVRRSFLRPIHFSAFLFLLVVPTGCAKELFAQSKEDSPETKSATPASSLAAQRSSPSGISLGTPAESPKAAASETLSGDAPPEAQQDPTPHIAGSDATEQTGCREQPPQDFLVRAHINQAPKNREELAEQRRLRRESIAYRTKHYGYVKGFGNSEDNPLSPRAMSVQTTFFKLPIMLNQRIVPVLKCVEERLKLDCASTPYTPTILSGLRHKNTYFDGEVSNHVYGIAIDIDPEKNPCCKCVSPWNTSPRCQGERTAWERMSMPRCWVEVFERYGFYWLGHDVLEDTMHFEFLGDPDQIAKRTK